MSEAKIIDGKAFAGGMREQVAAAVADLKAKNSITPNLTVVLVGEDPASLVYIRNKSRQAEAVGMKSITHHLPAKTSEEDLLALIARLNADETCNGILVQLPLPKNIDDQRVLESIDSDKDVDGFHPENVGLLALKKARFVSCTPKGIMRLLKESGIDPKGRRATVIGRSAIVGLPVALLLTHAHASVSIVHSRTRPDDLESAVRGAEILVVAVGRPGFVPGEWVREGAVVIDVGINRVASEDGKGRLVGDVAFEAAVERAGAITPVPGGVGPMTIAMLMTNTLRAAREQVPV